MARPGDVLVNPASGERIEFRQTAAETDGEALRFEYSLRPDGFAVGKVDHVHPRQRERIEVRSGRLGVRIDGDEWTATPGTAFSIPPGTSHTLWNDGTDVVRAHVTVEPALEMERLFETVFGLAAASEANALGLPGPLQTAVIADEFSEEIAVGAVPVGVQRPVLAAAAKAGRALGYRAEYPVVEERSRVEA